MLLQSPLKCTSRSLRCHSFSSAHFTGSNPLLGLLPEHPLQNVRSPDLAQRLRVHYLGKSMASELLRTRRMSKNGSTSWLSPFSPWPAACQRVRSVRRACSTWYLPSYCSYSKSYRHGSRTGTIMRILNRSVADYCPLCLSQLRPHLKNCAS